MVGSRFLACAPYKLQINLCAIEAETNIYANARDKYAASLSACVLYIYPLSCENLPREVKLDVGS